MRHYSKIFILVFIRVAMTLIGLITNKFVAIALGGSGIVIVGQLKSLTTLLMQVGIGGNNSLIVKLFSRGYDNNSSLYRSLFTFVVVVNILLLFLGIIFYKQIALYVTASNDYTVNIIYFILVIPAISLLSLSISITNGRSNQLEYGLFILSYPLILLLLLCLFRPLSIEILLLSFATSLAGSCIMISIYYRQYIFPKIGRLTNKNFQIVTTYGITSLIPFTVNIFLLIYLRHKMMLYNIKLAGYWQADWQINNNVVSILYMFIITVFLPKVLKFKMPGEAFSNLRKKYYFPIGLYFLSSLTFYIFFNFVITLLYNQEFRAGKEFLVYQLIGDLFKILTWNVSMIITSFGMIRISMYVEFLNLLISYILINFCFNKYGFVGGSYAYMYRYIAYFILMYSFFYFFYLRHRGDNG